VDLIHCSSIGILYHELVAENTIWKGYLSIDTRNLPEALARAIAFECGGEWEAGKAKPWTEDLERILGDNRLSQEKGYSSSF